MTPLPSYRPFPPADGSPYVIAHRGLSAQAPENTLAAFERAASTPGVDMVELDVRLTKDEEVVVHHDRGLQRTTTGNGPMRNYSLAEVRSYDAGSWFHPSFSGERVPTLHEVLERIGPRLFVNVEIKSDWLHRERTGLLETRVMETIRSADMKERVLISSFDHALVRRLKERYPEATTGVLWNVHREFFRRPSTLAARAGASVFVCARRELRRSVVEDAHAHGIAVYVYTLNSPSEIRRVRSLGVDGIMSNGADRVVPVVRASASAAHSSS